MPKYQPDLPDWINETKANFPGLFRDIAPCNFDVGEGWRAIIEGLCHDLTAMNIPGLRAFQIKQKFGGLRIYLEHTDEQAVYDRIDQAEALAAMTCEQCGSPTTKNSGQFSLTLCPSCLRKRREVRHEEG